MRKKGRNYCLRLMLLLFMFTISSVSAYATQSRTENFNKTYSLGSNQAENLVNVALKQVGKTKANLGYTEAWCADFVCDCAKLTGMADNIIPYNYASRGACTYLYNYMLKNCSAKEVSSRQKGDIVFYYCSGCGRYVHTGIVLDGTYTIEGNYGGKVTQVKNSYTDSAGHTLASGTVTRRYLRPNYKTEPEVNHNPCGSIDAIEETPEGVRLSGWVFDPDAPRESVEVHVYIGGPAGSSQAHNVYKLIANQERADVGKKYPNAGNYHGYSGIIPITGTEYIYIYFFNIGKGENVFLGSPQVTAKSDNPVGENHNPCGSIEAIEETPEGVRLSGWVFDPDAPRESAEVHVYVGGPAGSSQAHNVYKLIANQERADVGKKYPNAGNYHGYSGIIPITGTEYIYIYFFNIGKGENVFLGSPQVIGRQHNPVGEIESVTPTCDGVRITGWGMDGDALSECVDVHIYIAKPGKEPYRVYQVAADVMRADLAKKFSIAGGKHGIDVSFELFGTEDIYVYLINKGEGAHTLFKLSNISAAGHSTASQLKNKKAATCTSEGYSGDQYCSKCNKILQKGQVIPKINHSWDEGKITKVATCAVAGVKTYTCTKCKTVKTEAIPATGKHQNTELRNKKEATCTAEGYTGDTYCKDCGAKLQIGKAIAKKSHTWDAGKITQEATCSKTGIKTYACTVCKTTKTEEVPATGTHKNTELRNVKEATCTAEGYTGDTYCKDCGAKLQTGKAIAKKAHTWDAGKITQEATCAKTGIKIYTCTVCKTTKTENVPATGNHKNTELRNVKEATCIAEGYTGDTYCKDCGVKLQTGKAIAKKAHTWDAGKITQEATCAKTGIKTYTCTVCKTTKTEEVPATGVHKNTELRNVKEATCTEEGYTGDTYCKDCGSKIASGQKISKIEHSWNSGIVTTPPTCVEHGVKTYTCNICQTTKTEELPATGNHQNTELRNTKEASCTAEGYTGDIYCKDCGVKLQTGKTIAKKAHTWDAGVITTPATCTEKGVKTYTCTSCGGTKTNELPSTGHKQKEVRNKKAATCMQSGYTGDTYCKDCGKKLSSGKAIAKLAHKWDAGVITQEATCTEAGIKTYTCTVCESTRIEELPANGHGETVTKFAKEATCKMEGYTGDLYCKDCGELLEEGSVIAKLPHQWDAGKITKKATTTATGIRTYTCTKCGATKKETIPKIVPKKATPGKTVKDTATNGIYKVLADGLTVTFVRPAAKRATVRIPETVKVSGITCKVTEISANAFKNNAVLKTVIVGKNVKTIGVNAFYGCKNLTKVSGGAALVTICDRAFSNCAVLSGIVLPSTVKGIGKQAFYNCKKLRSITINTLSLTSKNVGAQAFTGTYAKAVVKVPAKKFAAYKSLLRAKGMNAGAVYTK